MSRGRSSAAAAAAAPAAADPPGASRLPVAAVWLVAAFAAGVGLGLALGPAGGAPPAADSARHPRWPAAVTLADRGSPEFLRAREAQVHAYSFPRYVTRAGVFSPEELRRVQELVRRDKGGLAWQPGTLGSLSLADGKSDSSLRSADVAPIPKRPEFEWLYLKIVDLINQVNDDHWQYLIPRDYRSPMVELLQVSRYTAGKKGHYAFHRDTGFHNATAKRRVSFTIQITDPDAYDGGDLELREGDGVVPMSRAVNTATVFPSIITHRVTTVTRGVRYSLVSWYGTL